MVKNFYSSAFLLHVHVLYAQTSRREIQPGNSIIWHIDQRLPHAGDMEMRGKKVLLWMQYSVDENQQLEIHVITSTKRNYLIKDGAAVSVRL
ncbi:hypothetical protein ACFSPU_04960 [Haoranjiania flava]|uniref:Uncharacterized protein n=1 Tax=Haoranjiania flava TaxID=1856322 RepID=A0AAE3INS9_9BACT|nr:hypothetical protein [Haoranjiania flava]MCU7693676.1 hypothetical protein [Haoranjiania flava]